LIFNFLSPLHAFANESYVYVKGNTIRWKPDRSALETDYLQLLIILHCNSQVSQNVFMAYFFLDACHHNNVGRFKMHFRLKVVFPARIARTRESSRSGLTLLIGIVGMMSMLNVLVEGESPLSEKHFVNEGT
jgi:hypothetical protein